MLKIIEIENIKGISHKKFELDIVPNKPSLLVAPNGFRKSSFATAFNSMNRNRINLQDDDYHEEDETNSPKVRLRFQKSDGTVIDLDASDNSNSISDEFGYFVINNLTKPKGIGSRFGTASARLEIEDIVLVNTIPDNISFEYSYRDAKNIFGGNGKVLPNLNNSVLNNLKLVEKLSLNYLALERANGVRVQRGIEEFVDQVNNENGTADELREWIETELLDFLKQINYVNEIGELISKFDLDFPFECENYLAAIQLVWIFHTDKNNFKNACKYSNYLLKRERYETMLGNFNSTWKDIRSSVSSGSLVVKFPKAVHLSNGQRDILTFISMLFKAKEKLNKDANILIIDEVFDYLDDANLTAAQYYITQFIDEFKKEDKEIYPLILTHLNPDYFKNFAFNSQKVYYLKKFNIEVHQHFTRLLRKRENETIEDDVSKYLLHYHPDEINKREEFRDLRLKETWGEGKNFYAFLNNEAEKYLNDRSFCPFAVCGAVRVKIEEIAYNQLDTNESREKFLATHGTRNKLDKAEELGVISPESHYLLGVIYNEGMHWREHQDNVSPIASKLENTVIQKLISDVINH